MKKDAKLSETECLQNCYNRTLYGFPPGCCGCCPSGSYCAGNEIGPVCCKSTQNFCGCISQRAYCEGSIYNSSQTVPPFGTCYTPSASQGVCCYYPSPNNWKICPANTTCCGGVISGANSITCCTSSQTCSIDTSGVPSCVPKQTTYTCSGQTYDPNSYRCINGALCAKSNGVCKGNVCYDPNNAVCFPQPCAGALQGNPANDVLCGKGLVNCGGICIDPKNYFCQSNQVRQKPQQGVACGSTFCTGNQQCCSSNQTGFPFAQCYDPNTSSCSRDPRGFGAVSTRVCPLSAYGKAQGACLLKPNNTLQCFDIDTQFCCQGSSPGGTSASILNISDQSMCSRNNPCSA